MMENKCNQTPNKYLDHVYCQPSGAEGRIPGYLRASNNNPGNGGGGSGGTNGSDFLAMLKENKQLKAMLILHLDLIQEQSDQLIAKDKEIGKLNEDLLAERNKTTQLDKQVQELQRQLQRQLKRAAATPAGELSLSPPPLAKIQCKKTGESSSASPTNNIIGECNGMLISKIVLQRSTFADSTHSPNSTTTISDTTSEDAVVHQHQQQQKSAVDVYDIDEELTTEESNDASEDKAVAKMYLASLSRGAKPRRPLVGGLQAEVKTTATANTAATSVQVCVTPPTPSRGKQMPLMALWHAPDVNTDDETGSGESAGEGEQLSTPAVSPITTPAEKLEQPKTTPKTTKSRSRAAKTATSSRQQSSQRHQQQQQPQPHPHKHRRRCTYLTTSSEYPTREWEDEDEKVCDYEFSREEANAIHAEAPMLEIPKWTEHDLSPSYFIEGTEDLSDESFLKRHAKLEIDEKRRKKWDVQQIREQRRVEKLKQRHYKNEIQEEQILKSFFPEPDGIQSICYVNELPVQAFGETIPKINFIGNFMLPWLQSDQGAGEETLAEVGAATATSSTPLQKSAVEIMVNSTASSTSAQANQQLIKSTFVFLKKRKRQQSASAATTPMGTQRQRSIAAASTATATVGAATPAKHQMQKEINILTTQNATTIETPTTTTTTTNIELTPVDAQAQTSPDNAKTPIELEQN